MGKEEKTVWDLELFEALTLDHFLVTKVPGGWVFYSRIGSNGGVCFVPYISNGKDKIRPKSLKLSK